eukprot:7915817-Pyramimonas_sp.AAC.1
MLIPAPQGGVRAGRPGRRSGSALGAIPAPAGAVKLNSEAARKKGHSKTHFPFENIDFLLPAPGNPSEPIPAPDRRSSQTPGPAPGPAPGP